jgi:hypothetical protein
LVAEQVLNKSMVRWTLDRNAFVSVSNLRPKLRKSFQYKKGPPKVYLDVMNPVVSAHKVDTVIGAEISTTNGQMVDLDIHAKVEDDVELRTINQEQVVHRGVGWRDQTDQSRPNCAAVYFSKHYLPPA